MATMLSEEAGYGITYGALVAFTLAAAASVPFVYKRGSTGEASDSEGAKERAADFFLSARGSQGWVSLGLSFFASSQGAWVLYAAPEVGALSGWWGVFGYACSSCLPLLVLTVLGPLVKSQHPDGFCLTDWVAERFGRPTQVLVALISVFYMWIYLAAELTSMGNLVAMFSGIDSLHALVPVSLVTMGYTMALGLPGSIWTDRMQGVLMAVVVIIAVSACFSDVEVASKDWGQVATWTDKGFEAFVTLNLAILGADLFNMGEWQRVYAATDDVQLRRGIGFACCLIFPAMILFGIAGMLSKAHDIGLEEPEMGELNFLAFFFLVMAQPEWVAVITFALSICMVASSVDSLQAGLVSVLYKEVKRLSVEKARLVAQAFVLAANVPAIILASHATTDRDTSGLGVNIINLFLIADLLTLAIMVPIFSGLGKFTTQTGVLFGCGSGFLVIVAFGWVEFGTFMAGMEMLTLMAFGNVKPEEVGLFASRTCVLCVILPIATGVVTYLVSWMERIEEYLRKMFAADATRRLVDGAPVSS